MREVESFREQASKKLKSKPTKYESITMKLLNKANIKYEFNKLIDRYIVDLFIPEGNIIIEINGKQYECFSYKRKDLLRDSWMWRYGYKVFRFKNTEISKLSKFIDTLKKETL